MSFIPRVSSEPTSLEGRDLALLIVMNLILGLNLIAAKVGVGQFPPIFFAALRFGSLAVLLLPFIRMHRGQMLCLLAAAALTGPATFSLLFSGLSLVEEASVVAIASQMGVPIAALLAVWLLGEAIRWPRRLGIALAFGGIAVISFDPRVFSYWEGLALVVASCVTGALGLIFVKRLKNIGPLELQAWIAVGGGPMLLLLSLAMESGQWQAMHDASWGGWTALIFTTVVASLAAHTAWYYLVSRYPVTSLSPVTLLSPLFSVFFGVTLLGDHLTPRMLVGGAVTLVGVFLVVVREKHFPEGRT